MQVILFTEHIPPTLKQVVSYFKGKKVAKAEAEDFYKYHELNQWKSKSGTLISNWKKAACKWVADAILHQQTTRSTKRLIPTISSN